MTKDFLRIPASEPFQKLQTNTLISRDEHWALTQADIAAIIKAQMVQGIADKLFSIGTLERNFRPTLHSHEYSMRFIVVDRAWMPFLGWAVRQFQTGALRPSFPVLKQEGVNDAS